MYTLFYDMHSGGGRKTPYDLVIIEAPEEQAKAVFCRIFGRDPERVTCNCCGPDFSISDWETLEEIVRVYGQTADPFSRSFECLLITAQDISRKGGPNVGARLPPGERMIKAPENE